MAVQRYSKYQYETSPRKLEPEYRIPKTKYPKRKPAPRVTPKTRNVSKESIINKKNQVKLVFAVAGVFLSILAISYRNSQIDEAFTKNEEMKQAYLAVEKENDQMKVDIENSLNYNKVEQQAKELLGMQTLSTKQTVYVNLPKKDYIQPATETVVIDKNENVVDKVLNKIKNMF